MSVYLHMAINRVRRLLSWLRYALGKICEIDEMMCGKLVKMSLNVVISIKEMNSWRGWKIGYGFVRDSLSVVRI